MRLTESRMTELVRATWALTWEPEELKETWSAFLKCIRHFEARQNKPNLTQPTAYLALDNLERQGFNKADKDNTWNQKLDTELLNKVTFDLFPTNPKVDTSPTGR